MHAMRCSAEAVRSNTQAMQQLVLGWHVIRVDVAKIGGWRRGARAGIPHAGHASRHAACQCSSHVPISPARSLLAPESNAPCRIAGKKKKKKSVGPGVVMPSLSPAPLYGLCRASPQLLKAVLYVLVTWVCLAELDLFLSTLQLLLFLFFFLKSYFTNRTLKRLISKIYYFSQCQSY